jgi:hypothetical protein
MTGPRDRGGSALTLCVLLLILVAIVGLVDIGSIVAGSVLGPAFILVMIFDLQRGATTARQQ